MEEYDYNEKLFIYSKGFVCCSICVSKEMTVSEVESEVNLRNPTGISSQWAVAEKEFSSGEPNPCPCDQEPETRMHYLLTC